MDSIDCLSRCAGADIHMIVTGIEQGEMRTNFFLRLMPWYLIIGCLEMHAGLSNASSCPKTGRKGQQQHCPKPAAAHNSEQNYSN